eukprot:jgi/Astpho2/3531/Aster-x1154
MLDGLWCHDPIALDFATDMHRLMMLGFNATRLPFSFGGRYCPIFSHCRHRALQGHGHHPQRIQLLSSVTPSRLPGSHAALYPARPYGTALKRKWQPHPATALSTGSCSIAGKPINEPIVQFGKLHKPNDGVETY